MLKSIPLLLVILLLAVNAKTQSACTTIGQTPPTAFPVCGVDTFKQASVPLCSTHSITVPGCPDAQAQGGYADLNPFWYQFTCYASGTLGFLITPNNLGDDYDWQLYDITGHDPDDVFTDPSLIVAGNWSGTYGVTGASARGVPYIQCASFPSDDSSTFAAMPNLIKGHVYLLLISHYTDTQSGYQLTFGGGTASITDPNIPKLQGAFVSCDGMSIGIKISKQVRCTSLAPNGSDFSISSGLSTIVSSSSNSCSTNFDFDSVILKLSAPLPVGNYKVTAKIGTDGNTLLDDCNNQVPVGDSAIFAIIPIVPTPLDSIAPVGCAPNVLELVFSKPIQCSTIAPDGSDFIISGSSTVSIQSASGICDGNDLTKIILINLNSPILSSGSYQIKLVAGDDGNTIIDECNQITPAGQTVSFSTKDTVSAQFASQVLIGCKYDSVQYTNPGGNGITQWQWKFDSASSSVQNPLRIDSAFGTFNAQLIVTNGVCSDTSRTSVSFDNAFQAAFSGPSDICPSDKAVFQNNSTGNINSWNWDFGDGTNSDDQTPAAHSFPSSPNQEIPYTVLLIAGNSGGCYDTATKIVTKVKSCYITVPSGFTPNGDGHNDYLYPLNAYKAIDLDFKVFNRYGELIFETRDWTKKWDGTLNGKPQDPGTFVWMLQYTDGDTGKKYFLKGTSVLIR
jgi:gliding motility-associated-like protein